MIAHGQEIPKDWQEQIISDYLSGMSVYQVQMQYQQFSRKGIYRMLHDRKVMRPMAREKARETDPDEQEILRQRDLIKASWTDEQARSRWIGRSRSKMEELGHCLSQVIPD